MSSKSKVKEIEKKEALEVSEFDVTSSDTVSLKLKVKNTHPNGRYNLLDLTIAGYQFKPYNLTIAQFEDLLEAGASAWIDCEEHPDLGELKKQWLLEKNR